MMTSEDYPRQLSLRFDEMFFDDIGAGVEANIQSVQGCCQRPADAVVDKWSYITSSNTRPWTLET